MNDPRFLAEQLNKELLDDPLIQEYQRYQRLIDEHPEIKSLEDEIKETQQELLQAKVHHQDDYDRLRAEYQRIYQNFYEHPLIANYLTLKEAVNDRLLEVEDIINNGLTLNVDLLD